MWTRDLYINRIRPEQGCVHADLVHVSWGVSMGSWDLHRQLMRCLCRSRTAYQPGWEAVWQPHPADSRAVGLYF